MQLARMKAAAAVSSEPDGPEPCGEVRDCRFANHQCTTTVCDDGLCSYATVPNRALCTRPGMHGVCEIRRANDPTSTACAYNCAEWDEAGLRCTVGWCWDEGARSFRSDAICWDGDVARCC
jgi:hypothetical protein